MYHRRAAASVSDAESEGSSESSFPTVLTPESLADEDLHVLQSLPAFWLPFDEHRHEEHAKVVKARLAQLIKESPWKGDQKLHFYATLQHVVAAGEKVYQILFFNLLKEYSTASKLTVAPYYYKGPAGVNCEIDATVTFLYQIPREQDPAPQYAQDDEQYLQVPILCVEFKDPVNIVSTSDRMAAHTQLGERFRYIRKMLIQHGVLKDFLTRTKFLYGVSSYGYRLKFYQYELQHGILRPILPKIPEQYKTIQTEIPAEEEWHYHLLYSNGVEAFNSLWSELHTQLQRFEIFVGNTPIQPSSIKIWQFKEFDPAQKPVFKAPQLPAQKRADIRRDIKDSLPPPVKVQEPTRSGRIPKVPEPPRPLTRPDPRSSSSSGAGGQAPPPGHDAGSGSRSRTTQAALISPSYGASSSSASYIPSYGQPTAGPSRSQTLGGVSSQQQQYQAQAQGYVPSYLPEPPAPSSSRPQRGATAPQPTHSVDALADEFENANLSGPSSSSRGSRSRTSRDPYGRHQ